VRNISIGLPPPGCILNLNRIQMIAQLSFNRECSSMTFKNVFKVAQNWITAFGTQFFFYNDKPVFGAECSVAKLANLEANEMFFFQN